jgi:hypothetical protein
MANIRPDSSTQSGFFVKEVLAVKSKTQKPGTVNAVESRIGNG